MLPLVELGRGNGPTRGSTIGRCDRCGLQLRRQRTPVRPGLKERVPLSIRVWLQRQPAEKLCAHSRLIIIVLQISPNR
jgi:hypothetical protein